MASSNFKTPTMERNRETEAQGFEAEERVEEAVAEATGKIRAAGAAALGKAKEAVSSVGDMAKEAVSAVGHKADDLTGAAGHQIKSLGDTLAQKAPHDGLTGQASQAVAGTIKGAGQYVEEAKLSGMAHDVERMIKNHPIPAILVCFGLGFCLGRAMKHS